MIVGMLAGVGVLVAPPALAASCSGSSVLGTGTVVVASGQTCSLSNQIVNAGITVNPGATLRLSNVLVAGAVFASRPTDIDVTSSVIRGSFEIRGTGDRTSTYDLCGNLIGGASTFSNVRATLHFGTATTCSGNRACGSLNTNDNLGVVSLVRNVVAGSGMVFNN